MTRMTRSRLTARVRALEIRWLIYLAAVVSLGWALAELTDEVIEGSTRDLDRDILLALRSAGDLSDPIGPPWLEEMGRDLTALGGVVVLALVSLLTALYFLMRRQIGSMVFLLVSVGGGILLSSVAKTLFDRPRRTWCPMGPSCIQPAFPPAHSMMAAVTYLTLGVLLARVQPQRRLKIFIMTTAVMLTLLVGISRVYLGVHWPTDVVAGWLAGAAWAAVCFGTARIFAARGQVEPEIGTGFPPEPNAPQEPAEAGDDPRNQGR